LENWFATGKLASTMSKWHFVRLLMRLTPNIVSFNWFLLIASNDLSRNQELRKTIAGAASSTAKQKRKSSGHLTFIHSLETSPINGFFSLRVDQNYLMMNT
jgi:hypothetical protein